MLVFYALPVTSMLLRSVSDPTWTLDNYRHLAGDSVFLDVFWTTLRTAFVVTAGTLLLGYPVALALSRLRAGRGDTGADPGAAAVLDQRAGAQLCLDGAAWPAGSGERGADRRAA